MKDIYKTFYCSPLGLLEIKATDNAVIRIQFTNKPGISQQHALLKKCLQQLAEYFEGKRLKFTIPLELRGTVFQLKVWEKIKTIPPGHTVSYQKIAEELNNNKASRAVGTACHRNQIAILIPCHRVIGKDRKLTGYAAGLRKKAWLLEHEKVYTSQIS